MSSSGYFVVNEVQGFLSNLADTVVSPSRAAREATFVKDGTTTVPAHLTRDARSVKPISHVGVVELEVES
jgi:hypothetical protein